MPLAEGITEASVKIDAEDYTRAESIALDTGLPHKHAVGAAIEGWASLPRSVRERIRRERLQRMASKDRRRGRPRLSA